MNSFFMFYFENNIDLSENVLDDYDKQYNEESSIINTDSFTYFEDM